MPSNTPLTDAIEALTRYANETTGASDTTLSDAVGTLVAGYGGGGGSGDIFEFSAGNINALIFHAAVVTTDYTDNQDALYVIKLKGGTAVNYEHFFGESTTGNTARTGIQRNGTSSTKLTVLTRAGQNASYSITTNLNNDVVLMAGRPGAEGTVSTTLPLLIGGGYYQGSQENQKSNMTFYGLNIIGTNNQYIARFMPWLEGSTPCVKELISDSLYYATSGTLGYIDKNGTVHN